MPAPRPSCPSAPGEALIFASLAPARLGMPELCRAGLSETWLWKACGHRHWLALAAAHGLERPDFRDARGERLYPAFTAVALEKGRLDAVSEHAEIDFSLTLTRTGRTRFRSHIAVRVGDEAIATLGMESVFVRRTVAGLNRSASREPVARPCRLLPMTKQRLADEWGDCDGLSGFEGSKTKPLLLDPSPHEDFNGADFLYFAAFQAMLDRAEWAWFRRVDPLPVTAARRIRYLGNIELGDRVRATLCASRITRVGLATRVELSRESDGRLIATASTSRRTSRRHDPGTAPA